MVGKPGFCQATGLSGQMVLRRQHGQMGAAGLPLGQILKPGLYGIRPKEAGSIPPGVGLRRRTLHHRKDAGDECTIGFHFM